MTIVIILEQNNAQPESWYQRRWLYIRNVFSQITMPNHSKHPLNTTQKKTPVCFYAPHNDPRTGPSSPQFPSPFESAQRARRLSENRWAFAAGDGGWRTRARWDTGKKTRAALMLRRVRVQWGGTKSHPDAAENGFVCLFVRAHWFCVLCAAQTGLITVRACVNLYSRYSQSPP